MFSSSCPPSSLVTRDEEEGVPQGVQGIMDWPIAGEQHGPKQNADEEHERGELHHQRPRDVRDASGVHGFVTVENGCFRLHDRLLVISAEKRQSASAETCRAAVDQLPPRSRRCLNGRRRARLNPRTSLLRPLLLLALCVRTGGCVATVPPSTRSCASAGFGLPPRRIPALWPVLRRRTRERRRDEELPD